MNDSEVLIDLYSKMSKHSNYQKLPEALRTYLNEDALRIKSRYEEERLAYILKNVAVQGKTVLDIGANTGFFSFELLKNGAERIHIYEGNKAHADFIACAAKVLGAEGMITVNNAYFDFINIPMDMRFDIILLLNVLHHIGDDYGDSLITLSKTKQSILESINSLSDKTNILIFQLGFNWQGDRTKPLFSGGTKQEMIRFIQKGVAPKWRILRIGIPAVSSGKIAYHDMDDTNVKRIDSLGEFLNRPLFILQSGGNSA